MRMLVNCQQGLTTGLFYRPAIRPRPRRTSSSIVFAWLAAIIVTVSQAFLTLFFSIRPEFQNGFLGGLVVVGRMQCDRRPIAVAGPSGVRFTIARRVFWKEAGIWLIPGC